MQIALVSAGVGLWDVEEAEGTVPLPLPKALGWQGAGTIAKVGDGVDGLAVGTAVLAYAPMGGFLAERITVPAAAVTPAPRSVPLADAGALLIGAATAYQALVDIGQLERGQRPLTFSRRRSPTACPLLRAAKTRDTPSRSSSCCGVLTASTERSINEAGQALRSGSARPAMPCSF